MQNKPTYFFLFEQEKLMVKKAFTAISGFRKTAQIFYSVSGKA